MARFFEFFPNGWDQVENAWAIQQDFLPHSPYILHFALGKVFYQVISDPAIASSALSSIFGLLTLVVYYSLHLRFSTNSTGQEKLFPRGEWVAILATLFVAGNYLFLRQSSTQ